MQHGKTKLLPQDIAVWLYLATLSLLIFTFRNNLPNWHNYIYFNLTLGAISFCVYWFLLTENGWQKFLRHLYPLVLFTFLYEESGRLVKLIHNHFLDDRLVNFELSVFGAHPTIWLERFYHPVPNEVFMIGYVSYYFLMPTLAIALYLKNKIAEINFFMLIISTAFYISYLSFIFFPVEGPKHRLAALEQTELSGPIFTPLAKWVIGNLGIHGGCFPSSHVAVAFITLVLAFQYCRKVGYVLAPFVITLCIGTFWGRFHYVTDMLAGIVLGGLVLWAVPRFIYNPLDRTA